MDLLGEQAAVTVETLRFNVLKAGTNVWYAGNVAGRSSVVTAITLTAAVVRASDVTTPDMWLHVAAPEEAVAVAGVNDDAASERALAGNAKGGADRRCPGNRRRASRQCAGQRCRPQPPPMPPKQNLFVF